MLNPNSNYIMNRRFKFVVFFLSMGLTVFGLSAAAHAKYGHHCHGNMHGMEHHWNGCNAPNNAANTPAVIDTSKVGN